MIRYRPEATSATSVETVQKPRDSRTRGVTTGYYGGSKTNLREVDEPPRGGKERHPPSAKPAVDRGDVEPCNGRDKRPHNGLMKHGREDRMPHKGEEGRPCTLLARSHPWIANTTPLEGNMADGRGQKTEHGKQTKEVACGETYKSSACHTSGPPTLTAIIQ